jgi:type IV pilus assembly protein PilQ
VPLEEALNNILAAHGFDYVTTENMIRIAPAGEILEKAERLTSKIYRITYADVEEVEKSLKKFISKRGVVSSNPGTSNIIVTDTEAKIKAIDTFIEEIDRMTPQILVEARIYDITSKDRLDLGIEWEGGRRSSYEYDETTGALIGVSGHTEPFVTGGFSGTTDKAESIVAGLRLGWLDPWVDIDMLLKAEQEIINAKLLANPRVLVLDNETATFKIISEIPYQELTETAAGGTIGSTDFREVGVELEVTPHLTRDEMVRVNLKPTFSVVTGEVVVGAYQMQLPQPVVDKREADTTLLVKNGQTVVLGGLRKREVTKQKNKVPFFGDLPLAGALFRFEGEDTTTSELVVFVTPWIIEHPVMSPAEEKQFGATEFEVPEPPLTRAEEKTEAEETD